MKRIAAYKSNCRTLALMPLWCRTKGEKGLTRGKEGERSSRGRRTMPKGNGTKPQSQINIQFYSLET